MSRYTDTRDAIVAAIKLVDPTCPVKMIHDRFRDPQQKNMQAILEIFGEPKGDKYRIHGWHFDRDSRPENRVDSNSGSTDAIVGVQSWSIEGFMTFVDAGSAPSTYEWQEIIDTFPEQFFNCPEIQLLEQTYNLVLVSAGIDSNSFVNLGGEPKCHWIQASLTFEIRY
jgi:hypothetical protein